ncbi:MAG: nucleotide-binding universal stress UspA family protein [Bacteroidia bacterium]|jgi:nucleotide-binding universal stress UspA family protein
MTKIIVLTDFSFTAKKATNIALKLAQSTKCQLHFFHTILTPIDWVKLSLEKENLYPEVKVKIAKAKSELSAIKIICDHKGIEYNGHLTFNRGGENLTEYIHQNDYDLVIMGSHGIHGVEKVIGTNTTQVVNQVQIPVLVVKGQTSETAFKNVVIYFDNQKDAADMWHNINKTPQFKACKYHFVSSKKLSIEEHSKVAQFYADLVEAFPKLGFYKTELLYDDVWTSFMNYLSPLKEPLVVLNDNHNGIDSFESRNRSHFFKFMNHQSIPTLCL